MSQPLKAADLVVDDDDTTKPYTHTQIEDMRKLVGQAKVRRIRIVDAAAFARFGESGTPAGMVGSQSAASFLTAGSFEARAAEPEPSVEVTEASEDTLKAPVWGPAANEPGAAAAEDADVPVSRSGAWADARVEAAAAPVAIDAEAPTAELSPAADEGAEPGASAELESPLPRSRAWIYLAAAVPLVAGLAVIWLARGRDGAVDETSARAELPGEARPEPEPEPGPGPTKAEPEPRPKLDLEPVRQIPLDEEAGDEDEDEDEDESESEGPAHETKRCKYTRRQAQRAHRKGDRKRAESLTRRRACWASSTEWKLLRMDILFELGRHGECIKLANHSNHPDIATTEKRCKMAIR